MDFCIKLAFIINVLPSSWVEGGFGVHCSEPLIRTLKLILYCDQYPLRGGRVLELTAVNLL